MIITAIITCEMILPDVFRHGSIWRLSSKRRKQSLFELLLDRRGDWVLITKGIVRPIVCFFYDHVMKLLLDHRDNQSCDSAYDKTDCEQSSLSSIIGESDEQVLHKSFTLR